MQVPADENVIPAHVSALDSAGHDVLRSNTLLGNGASDEEVFAAARPKNRVLPTYGRTDFPDIDEHGGVRIATETPQPRRLRAAESIERAYPTLDGVTEFVSDWTYLHICRVENPALETKYIIPVDGTIGLFIRRVA